MPLFISGSNGISGADGTAALPAVQGTDGNTGVFFPAADQVAIATGGVQRLLVDASGNVVVAGSSLYPLVQGTAVASTSGTAIDFTGIPSWVRRITVIFSGVSTNGTSNIIVQLGSGSFVTTGYASQGSSGATGSGVITTGIIALYTVAAASVLQGQFVLSLLGSNVWVGSGVHAYTNGTGACAVVAGNAPALSGALDRIRITAVNGTDAFDAGSINILYE